MNRRCLVIHFLIPLVRNRISPRWSPVYVLIERD